MNIPIVLMLCKKKQINFNKTSVIGLQVSSETRQDWLPTMSQDSRHRNRVPAAEDQSSGNNLVNLGSRNARWRFCGDYGRNSVLARTL